MGIIMKFCNGCSMEKELNTVNFKPNKSASTGWEARCRDCINAYYREHTKNNPEQRREKERKYKEKHPDKIKAKQERKRLKDKETGRNKKYRVSEQAKANRIERDKQRDKDPKRIAWNRARWERRKANGYNEQSRVAYQKNPLTRRTTVNRRRIRKLALKGSHTPDQVLEKYHYHGEACYYCKVPLTIQEMTIDHRIPVSRNGTDFIANIVPCCGSCNASKRDKTDKEFILWLNKLAKGVC